MEPKICQMLHSREVNSVSFFGSVNIIVRTQVKETGTEIPEQNQKFV